MHLTVAAQQTFLQVSQSGYANMINGHASLINGHSSNGQVMQQWIIENMSFCIL